MKTGDIILIPFPFSDLKNVKVRPALVITITKDGYDDIVISAISSVIPGVLGENEMIIKSSPVNNLRTDSVLKVDRIVTLKNETVITNLGRLNHREFQLFRRKFFALID